MTATVTATRNVVMPFADRFAMSGTNAPAWRAATTDVTYGANKQVAVRLLTTGTTTQLQAQHQAIPATPAFKTPAGQGTKGSSPWGFPV